jgi:serine/threonine-protein kinase
MELGKYKLIKSLGKGGMGEVFLAYDPVCDREVALKRIREDLVKYKTMHDRFLREAHIAAALTHPSIIPIFSIHEAENLVYYTMPYVEGETLKQILKNPKEDNSIAYLMRIFLSVCQAIAYCHSKTILHRDLKPENIIVGKFGEVLILDWGLAEYFERAHEEGIEEVPGSSHLTRPGKVVGTLSHLAPERALGEPASELSELYALGVILYQMLTLKLPFKRTDLQTFQKTVQYEEFIDPIEAAPYRDIPRKLADIAKKCLYPEKNLRDQTVSDLISDIETYIEGRPEWILTKELKIDNKRDWEFQENVLLAKHIAITRSTEVMEWVSLMISRGSFSGNTKLEATIRLGESGEGIGFLLNIPEADERKDLMDGYCLWIGSEDDPGCRLFRSNIEVMRVKDVSLKKNKWHNVRIEKRDNHLRFFLDDALRCHYISHTPLGGTHVGILCRDADFDLEHFQISIGSQNVVVSCLAIPDAFLANKDFSKALIEYRRIAYSFPGRAEEREALFRAGVTLLEAGLAEKKGKRRSQFYGLALEEFGKLRNTAGAPLEYLGKSLVYKAIGEIEEEVKCLELAIRKYSKHPLLPRLVEHVVFRLHESSSHNRLSAYHFALLCLRQLPQIFENPDNQKLLDSLKQNWEPLYFAENNATAVQLAFFLAKPITLMEIIEGGQDIKTAFFALLELGCNKIVKENQRLSDFPEIQTALLSYSKAVKHSDISKRALTHIFQTALDHGKAAEILPLLTDEFDDLRIWACLYLGKYSEAGDLLEKYPLELRTQETSSLYFLFGCYLWATEGEAIAKAHFSGLLETPYPRTTALLGHFLSGKLDLKKGWIRQAFFWEKQQLYRQLSLFYRCAKNLNKAAFFEKELQKEKRYVTKR